MKKFSALMILAFMTASIAFAQPALEVVGGDTYDWGQVQAKDSPLKAKIQLKNSGNETLNISKVKPTCGCTTAPLDKDKLEPGEIATLNVTLNVSHYSGNVTKSIRVHSNDPSASTKYIKLKANVFVPVEFFPKHMNFAAMKVGKEAVGKIVLKNKTDADIKILNVRPSSEEITTNLEEGLIIPAHKDFTVEAKYMPSKSGRVHGKVYLKTDSQDAQNVSFTFYGNAAD